MVVNLHKMMQAGYKGIISWLGDNSFLIRGFTVEFLGSSNSASIDKSAVAVSSAL